MKNLYEYVTTAEPVNTLKSRELRTLYEEGAISVTLRIKSLSTSSNAIYVAETRFREIKDMMSCLTCTDMFSYPAVDMTIKE